MHRVWSNPGAVLGRCVYTFFLLQILGIHLNTGAYPWRRHSASSAAAVRREQVIMSSPRSPRVVSCIGGRPGRDSSYRLFLEFARGGSLADEVARTGGLDECSVRGYAADVARGLA